METTSSKPVEFLKWCFPTGGNRKHEDITRKSFNYSLSHFVREVIQNSLDAWRRHKNENDSEKRNSRIVFELIELVGEEKKEFYNAYNSGQKFSYEDHLKSMKRRRANGEYENYFNPQLIESLKRKYQKSKFLVIHDYGTEGLYGREYSNTDENSPFVAFARDEGKTEKGKGSASGGSHGMGKVVMWMVSNLKSLVILTCIKNERKYGYKVNGDPSANLLYRVYGRSRLNAHDISFKSRDYHFNEHGQFGLVQLSDENGTSNTEIGVNSNSFITSDIEDLTFLPTQVLNARKDRKGTTIIIPEFDFSIDQELAEEDSYESNLMDRILYHAAEYFWPAVITDGLEVEINYQEDKQKIKKSLDLTSYINLKPFIDLYNNLTRSDFEETDTQIKGIVEFPDIKKNDTIIKLDGELRKGIVAFNQYTRNISSSEDYEALEQKVNSIAYLRGANMVVNYEKVSTDYFDDNYYGLVIAGTAVPSVENGKKFELFLKMSEPASHDRWFWEGTSLQESLHRLVDKYPQPGGFTAVAKINKFIRNLSQLIKNITADIDGGGLDKLSGLFESTSDKSGPGNGGSGSGSYIIEIVDEPITQKNSVVMKLKIHNRYWNGKIWDIKLDFNLIDENQRNIGNSNLAVKYILSKPKLKHINSENQSLLVKNISKQEFEIQIELQNENEMFTFETNRISIKAFDIIKEES